MMGGLKTRVAAKVRRRALSHGTLVPLWRRLERPSMHDWAEYLRLHGGFAAFGEDCAIVPSANFTDPYLTRIGNNVHMSGEVVLTCHDGSVNVINRAYGLKLDSVGPVAVGDNVFVGHGAIILPNVTIGDNVIVGAGVVVARDVPAHSIVVGSPSRVVGKLSDYVERLKERNSTFPWLHIIEKREGDFDPELEPTLMRLRQSHFFGAHL